MESKIQEPIQSNRNLAYPSMVDHEKQCLYQNWFLSLKSPGNPGTGRQTTMNRPQKSLDQRTQPSLRRPWPEVILATSTYTSQHTKPSFPRPRCNSKGNEHENPCAKAKSISEASIIELCSVQPDNTCIKSSCKSFPAFAALDWKSSCATANAG